MDEMIEEHLYDVLNAANEVEQFFEGRPKLYEDFQQSKLLQRAVERNVEIIGEAMPGQSSPDTKSRVWESPF